MKDFNVNQFFRYLAPGSVSIIYYLYLRAFEHGGRLDITIPRVEMGGGAVPLYAALAIFGAAVLGYLYATAYHVVINLRCGFAERNLRADHRPFFIALTVTDRARLRLLERSRNSDIPEIAASSQVAEMLSCRGAAALFDSSFYRLRESLGDNCTERFESFFHILHGLGATLTGLATVSLLWVLHGIMTHEKPSADPIYFWIIPTLSFLLIGWNWFQLRRMSIAYVEGWFLDVLRRVTENRPGDWDQNIPPVIEVSQFHLVTRMLDASGEPMPPPPAPQ